MQVSHSETRQPKRAADVALMGMLSSVVLGGPWLQIHDDRCDWLTGPQPAAPFSSPFQNHYSERGGVFHHIGKMLSVEGKGVRTGFYCNNS